MPGFNHSLEPEGTESKTPMQKITVLLADDHVMLMDGLLPLVRQEFDVVGVARDGRALLDMARELRPNVIATDIRSTIGSFRPKNTSPRAASTNPL